MTQFLAQSLQKPPTDLSQTDIGMLTPILLTASVVLLLGSLGIKRWSSNRRIAKLRKMATVQARGMERSAWRRNL
jgi:hypothetical protein